MAYIQETGVQPAFRRLHSQIQMTFPKFAALMEPDPEHGTRSPSHIPCTWRLLAACILI